MSFVQLGNTADIRALTDGRHPRWCPDSILAVETQQVELCKAFLSRHSQALNFLHKNCHVSKHHMFTAWNMSVSYIRKYAKDWSLSFISTTMKNIVWTMLFFFFNALNFCSPAPRKLFTLWRDLLCSHLFSKYRCTLSSIRFRMLMTRWMLPKIWTLWEHLPKLSLTLHLLPTS